jgi:hypothetical protein
MRPGQALFSAVQFLITVLVLGVGGFFLFLPFAPHMRFQIASLFFQREAVFLFIGSGFLGLGVILLIGFYFMNRHTYYQLEMKAEKHTAAVEVELLRKMMALYWKKAFPEKDLTTNVLLHQGKEIEVVVEVSHMKEEEEREFLKKVEKEVGAFLEDQLGYSREFLLTVVRFHRPER